MEKEKTKCPVCLGSGVIFKSKRGVTLTEVQKKKLFKMYREGNTLRAIANEMGIKHPQSVAHIIDQAKK